MTATAIDLSAIKTDALSAASTFRTLIGLGSSATLNAGSANGVATLGADSKLTAAQIPDISLISYLGSVASQAAMLALSGQQGDWCVRSDLSTTWVITGSDPTLLANWTQLSYPSVPVQSVFGRTGAVVGVSTDYSAVGITNTAIGASNPSTGAFTTLSANSATLSTGTITASTPAIDITQTWNDNSVGFTGFKFNATDTASNSFSLIADWQIGGVQRFAVSKLGYVSTNRIGAIGSGQNITFESNNTQIGDGGTASLYVSNTFNVAQLTSTVAFGWCSGGSSATSLDLVLRRDAANTLAQRNGTNAQTFRIYNTTDAGLTNYERAKIAWSSNVLQIGTEGLGTGAVTPRSMEFQTNGTTRLTIDAGGGVTVQSGTTLQVGSGTSIDINGFTVVGVGKNGFRQSGGGYIIFNADGVLKISNNSDNGFGRLQLGGTTSSFPAIKRNSAALNFRLADDSGDCDITAKAATFSGNVTVSAVNIVTDTTTGTKIGTATNQKLGFYDKTPVVQPAAVADATDAASVITQLNLLLARMRDLGLIAT